MQLDFSLELENTEDKKKFSCLQLSSFDYHDLDEWESSQTCCSVAQQGAHLVLKGTVCSSNPVGNTFLSYLSSRVSPIQWSSSAVATSQPVLGLHTASKGNQGRAQA